MLGPLLPIWTHSYVNTRSVALIGLESGFHDLLLINDLFLDSHIIFVIQHPVIPREARRAGSEVYKFFAWGSREDRTVA